MLSTVTWRCTRSVQSSLTSDVENLRNKCRGLLEKWPFLGWSRIHPPSYNRFIPYFTHRIFVWFIHHHLVVQFLPRLINSICNVIGHLINRHSWRGSTETATSQQHKVDNQPSATLPFWDLSISHSDTSIFEKIPFSHYQQLCIHGNVGMSFWWLDVLPNWTSSDYGIDMLDLASSSVESTCFIHCTLVSYFVLLFHTCAALQSNRRLWEGQSSVWLVFWCQWPWRSTFPLSEKHRSQTKTPEEDVCPMQHAYQR